MNPQPPTKDNPVPTGTHGIRADWFVGREKLLQDIQPLPNGGRVVAVSGVRGQGKSSLAQKCASEFNDGSTLILTYEWKEPTATQTNLVTELWKQAVDSGQLRRRAAVGHLIGVNSRSLGLTVTGIGVASGVAATLGVPLLAWTLIVAAGGGSALFFLSQHAPSDVDALCQLFSLYLKPTIKRVVVLIDEVLFGLEQSRDLAKGLHRDTKDHRALDYHTILFCLPDAAAKLSTTAQGPRSLLLRELSDFDLVDTRHLVQRLVNESGHQTQHVDDIAYLVLAETGGIPDVTLGLLHAVWQQWTTNCKQQRAIATSDVIDAVNASNGLHQERVGGIVNKVSLGTPQWKNHWSRLLSSIADDETLDLQMSKQSLRSILQGRTTSDKNRTPAVDGLIDELLNKSVLRGTDDSVELRGRLLRRTLTRVNLK